MSDELSAEKPRIHALLPAAGFGQRFGGPIPKQYMELAGKPIIQHSIERLFKVVSSVTVAISEDDDYWAGLDIAKDPRIKLVAGGKTRAESVQNALESLKQVAPSDWVLVHDAVRPLVKAGCIAKLFSELAGHEVGGILATQVFETVKREGADREILSTEDRAGLWLAQTPQMFRYEKLQKSLQQADGRIQITDESSALEAAGYSVKLVEGCRSNIKITRPADLAFAQLIISGELSEELGEERSTNL